MLLLAVSFASGFYVFSLENLMIRVAGLVIGSSNYTFSMIVAAFILGIALGSLWVGRRRVHGPGFFFGVQVALLISSVVLYLLVPVLPEWFARIRVLIAPAYLNIPYYWTAVFSLFALILLLPVALMGMNLPLIFNYLRSRGLFPFADRRPHLCGQYPGQRARLADRRLSAVLLADLGRRVPLQPGIDRADPAVHRCAGRPQPPPGGTCSRSAPGGRSVRAAALGRSRVFAGSNQHQPRRTAG